VRYVVWQVAVNVSEGLDASIFRVYVSRAWREWYECRYMGHRDISVIRFMDVFVELH
jgi:hypothetical protein